MAHRVFDSFVQWLLLTKNEHNSIEVRLIKMVTITPPVTVEWSTSGLPIMHTACKYVRAYTYTLHTWKKDDTCTVLFDDEPQVRKIHFDTAIN
ncbi:hypothetical protein EMCRGX_G010974 [Ephydatia muelleri]